MTRTPEETTPWTIHDAIRPGLAALKSQWRAFLLIQIAAIVLVVVYYSFPQVHSYTKTLEGWKLSGGLLFSFLVGAFAGGIAPEIAKFCTRSLDSKGWAWLGKTAYISLIFGIVGVLIDLFYQGQTWAFGSGNDPLTLLKKTFMDMGVVAPFFFIPFELSAFRWPQNRYRFVALFQDFEFRNYRKNVLPTMLPCWGFWIPVLFCVYAMPSDLQFCFGQFAEAAWSIIIVFVATKRGH